MKDEFKLILFLIYTILWQGMVWYGFYHIVFVLGKSAWWVVLAIVLAGSQFKPPRFGLPFGADKDDVD